MESVIRALTAQFGPPTRDSGPAAPCTEGEPGTYRAVSWGALTAMFDGERGISQINDTPVPKAGVAGLYLWGWRDDGTDLWDGSQQSGPPGLATADGLALGTPLATAQKLIGPFALSHFDQPDPRPPNYAQVNHLILFFATEQAEAPIVSISSGRFCSD